LAASLINSVPLLIRGNLERKKKKKGLDHASWRGAQAYLNLRAFYSPVRMTQEKGKGKSYSNR